LGAVSKKAFAFICAITAIVGALDAFAQTTTPTSRTPPQQPQLPPQLMPPHPPSKMGPRYFNIDAKRAIANMYSEEALPYSREFKRIDSTYYVGWMYEGVYKYDHAADYLGYKNAAVPLERALTLMERDYAKALATRANNIMELYPIRAIQPDYTTIAYYLVQCYGNTEQPEKLYALLRRAIKWNFQFHYSLDAYDYLAWTVHRNRFYTSAKYSFLKNSIDENEKLANRYLDTALMMIEKNKAINAPLAQYLTGNFEEREKMSVYHYKTVLYSYNFNVDSADHYFDLMRKARRLPHNNYANFRVTVGDFKTAEEEYTIASTQDAGDKRLQEWAYYTSILNIYKAKPKAGIDLSRNMIKSGGTTPGYGWYNIALARTMLYDGQISESKRYADKAAEFKELHIGTTLGQSHYDFSIQLLKLIGKENEWAMEKFEHANWWYNPKVLLNMSQKLSEKYLQQFLIINQFAQNPERDRVIYKLFSTESTVSWDEIWYLVRDFSTKYFITRFQKEAQTDNRKYIHKYFELFVALLKIQQGKHKEAKAMLDKLQRDPTLDVEYEKLFLARVYQAEAECAEKMDKPAERNDWLYRMYSLYPQLVPFTGMKMNMRLHVSGNADKDVVDRLKGFNINWAADVSVPAPEVYVIFDKKGTKKNISYYVLDSRGNYIVHKQGFAWQKPEEAAKGLAYRLFNIGGKTEEQQKEKQQ
jgi:hypothetical protein